jgi:hypothetical protein
LKEFNRIPLDDMDCSLLVHLLLWFLLTVVSNAGASFYIGVASDPITPCTLSLLLTVIIYQISGGKSSINGSGPDTVITSKRAAWELLLGLLHFIATILSFASYALSSVSWTYVFRTLEPLCSAAIQFIVFGETCTVVELGLLMLVAASVAMVAMPGSASMKAAAAAASHPNTLKGGGTAVPIPAADICCLSCCTVCCNRCTRVTTRPYAAACVTCKHLDSLQVLLRQLVDRLGYVTTGDHDNSTI